MNHFENVYYIIKIKLRTTSDLMHVGIFSLKIASQILCYLSITCFPSKDARCIALQISNHLMSMKRICIKPQHFIFGGHFL